MNALSLIITSGNWNTAAASTTPSTVLLVLLPSTANATASSLLLLTVTTTTAAAAAAAAAATTRVIKRMSAITCKLKGVVQNNYCLILSLQRVFSCTIHYM